MQREIVIVQPYVPKYREPFFKGLQDTLKENDIFLTIACAEPASLSSSRGDSVLLTNMRHYKEKGLTIAGKRVRLGTAHPIWKKADAVIVPDYGSSLDSNLASLRFLGPRRVGIWGHIKTYNSIEVPLDKAIERWQLRRASHIFSYMPSGRDYAMGIGVPQERITVVYNTFDTEDLSNQIRSLRREGFVSLIEGTDPDDVLAYIGALDRSKRIDFLASVLDRLWILNKSIKIIIAGSGEDEHLLECAVARGQAIKTGYADNRVKAQIGMSAGRIIAPGAIGLLAVDALTLGLPVLALDGIKHGPEIEYLTEGGNLFKCANKVEDFADLVMQRFNYGLHPKAAPPLLSNMISNFAQGIMKMLDN